MKKKRLAAPLLAGGLLVPGICAAKGGRTDWDIRPSQAYDTLSALNLLTGDPFYLAWYQAAYDSLYPRLPEHSREAMGSLDRIMRSEHGQILSASFSLYFSAVNVETLDDVFAAIDDPAPMREAFSRTTYFDEDGWQTFLSVRKYLRDVLTGLVEIGFEERWAKESLPRVQARITAMAPELEGADVVSEVERVLGHPLESNRITVYVLDYARPHGIRITGTRFITDVNWPSFIVLGTAVHEMMHPPLDFKDPALHAALEPLRTDAFLMDKVEHHNPVFGYNSFEGFLEEDIVQALDQVVSERLGFAREAGARWRQSDDGMHVLAVALYMLMKDAGFARDVPAAPGAAGAASAGAGHGVREFLLDEVNAGRLAPGKVEALYQRMYAAPPPTATPPPPAAPPATPR